MALLPVFVYGTLRHGSWNHERWLAPWIDEPTVPATLAGHALHHHGGLPYITPAAGHVVVGELARLAPARYDAGLAKLDELEDLATRHYDRVEVEVLGEPAWVYVAGPRITKELDPSSRVGTGDWLSV